MLNEISNPSKNNLVHIFNEKIREYNQKCQEANINILDCLQLLQEVNHIHMHIKRLLVDDQSHIEQYEGIRAFMGIGTELSQFNLPIANGLVADTILTSNLSNNLGLPTIEQWHRAISSGSFISKPSEQGLSIAKDLEQLDKIKTKLPDPPSPASAKKYMYALKSFKQTLLDKLSYELTNETDIRKFRALLQRVNHEIVDMQNLLPNVKNKHEFAQDVMKTSLYRELSQLPSDKMDQLVRMLKNREAINPGPPVKEDLVAILPSLIQFDLQKLGGGNNLNWKISDPDTGMELVFQVGLLSENQALIHRLEHSPVNDYLSTPFFSSSTSAELPFSLVVTDLCSGGDLISERERTLSHAPMEGILQSAISRLDQLTSICQELTNQRMAHPDIKLTNFLTDSAGNIVITDKKSFIEVDNNGDIPLKGLVTTVRYSPPEFRQRDNKVKLNAAAFMTYQLGVALYEYLVLPKVIDSPAVTPWYYQSPLDFTNPIFASEAGEKIQTLIKQMTDPDPGKRPSLSLVKRELNHVLPRVEQVSPVLVDDRNHAETPALKTSYAYRTRGFGREHGVLVKASDFHALKSRYKELQGDALKSKILDDFKSRIGGTGSLAELEEVKAQIKQSDEYKVLNQSQGKITRALQYIGKNTTSINTLNDMFKEQEQKFALSQKFS